MGKRRVVVVGAGAWGLPAAAELAGRGHEVTCLDRYGIGNLLSSSAGPTRLWRISHPDALRVRLALRSVQAWRSLEQRSDRTILLRRGLLWRDESAGDVASALSGEGVEFTDVSAGDVSRFFPGLRADGRDAVWQEMAGPLLARQALAAQADLLDRAGGRLTTGPAVVGIDTAGDGVQVRCSDGSSYDADTVVIAAGPGSGPLLSQLGLDIALGPHLEQVAHVGEPHATDNLPCLFDGPRTTPDGIVEAGLYAMPTPGRGYKVGLDSPVRASVEADTDRTPSPAHSAAIAERVRRDLTHLDPRIIDAQVCTWTDSPDGRFIIDAAVGGQVVIACGDSGEGFKFSALMGEVLADLAEGIAPDADVATFARARIEGVPMGVAHALGR